MGVASGMVRVTKPRASSLQNACMADRLSMTSAVTMPGAASTVSTTSSNSWSFDPKYRLTSIAVTPAASAISRTPTS
ncbi:hypothetical protein D3C87_1706010 [compost metagenome]